METTEQARQRIESGLTTKLTIMEARKREREELERQRRLVELAAPELLAALKGFETWLSLNPENYQKHFADRLVAARAAIAKAEGK